METQIAEGTINLIKKKRITKAYLMKETLVQELPNCFKKGNERQPLCIGIHIQIHTHYKEDLRFEPSLIQQGLNKYCSNPKYLKNIIAGTARINIHGSPTGLVTPEDEANAKQKLQKIENDVQLKLQRIESKKLLKVASIKTPTPVVKIQPVAIPLEELRKNIAIREKSIPQASPSKEELKLQKQIKYAKKMARKATPKNT